MPSRTPQDFKINFDMSNLFFAEGGIADISSGENEDYVTNFTLVIPISRKEFKPGEYFVNYNDKQIKILLYEVLRMEDDLLGQQNFSIGSGGSKSLPFVTFTDHRGQYPAFFAQIIFPYRIATWFDAKTPLGVKVEDQEETQVLGAPINNDKVEAIKVLNRLFKSESYGLKVKNISYNEITVFLECYKQKDSSSSDRVLKIVHALTSKDAYKDALYNHYLGSNRPNVLSSLAQLGLIGFTATNEVVPKIAINDEKDLFEVVLNIIESVIRHHIENRNWIQAFWDGARFYKHEDLKISLPAHPKKETDIQPTLYVLLEEALSPLGIHVEREASQGVGDLDYKCLYTTKDDSKVCICVEFKIAHNKKIKHGLNTQLPAYLKANKSKLGIYLIMWFKDEKEIFFKEPIGKKEDLLILLEKLAGALEIKEGYKITPKLIDASIRPTASQL